MTPNSTIYLLDISKLSTDYANTYDFRDKQSQYNYFYGNKKRSFDDYSYIRKNNSIKVECFIDDIITECNYLMYKNNNKWYYCFIVDMIYINDYTTELVLQLDVVQTYLFDYTVKDSYVERCHVDRWRNGLPTREIENEGLEFGDHEVVERKTLHQYSDSYVYITDNPLGVVANRKKDNTPTGGTGGAVGDGGNWELGEMSAKGFRFTKGQEGWTATKHQDPGGTPIIAYGITPNYDKSVFNKLVSEQPLTEEYGAKETYKAITTLNKPLVKFMKETLKVDSQQKFDAIADFVFTAGGSYVTNPDSDLFGLMRKYPNDESKLRPVWENYIVKAGGVVQLGLQKRRKAECDIYFGKGYWNKDIDILGTNRVMDGDGWLPVTNIKPGADPGGKTFVAEGYKWQYPLRSGNAKVTSLPGNRYHPVDHKWKWHRGIDIGCPLNTPVYATRDGVVTHAGDIGDGLGRYVRIEHTDIKYETWYAHNESIKVRKGDRVKAGDIIALAGSTGKSTGVHLHYELRKHPYTPGTDSHTPIPPAFVGMVM